MKRKFIFLAMLLLTLIGGVKWNVLNAQEQQYRIKALSYNSTDEWGNPVGPYSFNTDMYLNINNNDAHATGPCGGVGVTSYSESNSQIFTLEDAGNNTFYIKSIDGYYIYCQSWNVDAIDQSKKSAIGFSYNDDNTFYMMNGTRYFKVESVSGSYYPFCDYIYTDVAAKWVLEEVINDNITPAPPVNLEAIANSHNKISLTWTAGDEYAISYNIYRDNELIAEKIKGTSYAVENLPSAETQYCFTVKAVRGNNLSEPSQACATTLVAPKTRKVVFVLTDSYGDGWNGGKLNVTTDDGYSGTLTHTSGKTKEYTIEFSEGATVTVDFKVRGTYPSECSYSIYYDDNDENIVTSSTSCYVNGSQTYSFVVKAIVPSLTVNVESINLGNVKMDNYWSENTVSKSFNVVAENTSITGVSCNNTFFDVDYDETTGIVTVGYNKTADVTGEQTGIITIKATDIEDVTVDVSATPYTPVTPDVIELATNVTFEEGVYTDIPEFTTLHDDYNLPKEVNAGSTPDAVYHFTMEEDGVLTVNVTGTNAIAAVYEAEKMKGSGPMANNDCKGGAAGPAVPAGPTTFEYDFSNNGLDGLTVIDSDGDGNNWFILSGAICSESYKGGKNLTPDNYIFTNEAYSITQNSKLLLNYLTYTGDPEYCAVVVTSDINDISKCQIVVEKTFDSPGDFTLESIDLSAFAGETVHIGLRHFNSVGEFKILINQFQLTDGSAKSRSLARSTEPQINAVQYPAGEYYLVAAAEDDFTVSIETGSLPVPGEFAYTAPADGAKEQSNPKLTWEAAQYATEYKVYLGTESTLTEENLVTTVATPSYQTEGLSNNTKYFWRVDAVNATGTTPGSMVYSFVTPLDVPQNVAATSVNLYPGESTTISWEAVTNASSYKVYNGDNLLATLEPTVTSYELSGLAYNINGHNISITATQEGLGESLKSSVVVIKVAGEFQLVVSVKDSNGYPIKGATVSIDMTQAYDQFGQQVKAVNPETTGDDGNATFTSLPLLHNSTRYIVTASKAPYEDATNNIYYYDIINFNNNTYTHNSTLYLPKVSNLEIENGDVVLVEGSELVLTWDVIEGATEYKVYKKENLVETVTTNEFTTTAEYDNVGSKYAVSAVFEGELESDKTYTDYIYVLGNGSFKGYVTDGTSPIKNLTFELSGTNAIGEDVVILTTNAEGYFEGEILEGNDYTLTISHYDYEEVVMSGIEINYSTPFDFGTIVLTAKPSVEDNIDVTATDNGEYASVTWTGSYEKYNVYRRNMSNQQEVELLAEVAASPYTDNEWAELEDGTYQYGVSTFVEEQAQSRGGEEVIYKEDFNNCGTGGSADWKILGSGGCINNYGYVYSGYGYYLGGAIGTSTLTSNINIDLTKYNGNITLKFYNYNGKTQSGIITKVNVKKTNENTWTTLKTISDTHTQFMLIEVDLSNYRGETIVLQFEVQSTSYGYSCIDEISIVSQHSAKESQIVWSNNLKKQGPNTFEGTVSTDWNTAANWSRNEVPEGADVIINANAVISSDADVNVKNLNIKSGSLTIEGILAVTGTITNNGNLIINDGAQLFQNNEDINATFNMSIISPDTDNWESNNKEGWQFISSPFLDATVASFIPSEGEYDLYKYDGTQDYEWINHKGENSGGSGESGDTFYYDFNDASVDDWTKIDEDGDGQNWGVTSSGIYAGYEESVGLYSSCYANDTELYPDNYFVTNKAYAITSTSFLSFLHHTSDALYTEENFGVVVSENGTDWIVIWSKKYDYNAEDEDWQEANVSLADYAGKNVYLGFRHYNCNGSSANGIRIDNVRLSSEVGNSASGTSSFEETFTQGVGYLASYEKAATVALNGELNPNTNKTWGQYYYNAEKDLANFRLLGNPFTFDMDMSKLSSYGMATGYAVVNANGEYEYKTDGTINVGDGFFVKVAADYATLTYSHVAPVSRGSEKANSINVIASGKAGKDNVIVNFAGQSEGFNKLQNFNEDIATVFVANNGKRYGIANVDENATEVELSFVASQMGNYSISLDVNGEFETVTLVDRFTGIETNMLLEDEYNFTATSNDSHNRFVIRLANGQEPTTNSQFVYQSGEELILSIEGSVQIVDMLGRVVYYNEHANGDNRINVAEFNDAAYVVRVVNEEGVKVQKVVIY